MKLLMKLKMYRIFLIFLIVVSTLFSVEYSDYGFDLFSISSDPLVHAISGIPNPQSMALNKIYTLNDFHDKGKLAISYGRYYSGLLESFQVSYILMKNNDSGLGFSLIQKKIESHNTEYAYEDNGEIISPDQIDYNNIAYYDNQQIGIVVLYSNKNKVGDLGIKIKPIYTSDLNEKGFGISFDVGFNKQITQKYLSGISINNFLSINKWSTDKVESNFPHLYFSNIYLHEKISLYSELSLSTNWKKIDYFYNYKIGASYLINNNFKVLIGYSKDKLISFGMDLKHKSINYSYSFNPNFQDILLGQDHQFGILLDLSKKKMN